MWRGLAGWDILLDIGSAPGKQGKFPAKTPKTELSPFLT
jgi:hypothetical protein